MSRLQKYEMIDLIVRDEVNITGLEDSSI